MIQWCPASRYDMSNPQNLQPAQALAQMMASIAALQQEQAAEHQRHLQDLQALTERQTQVLQNFLAQFGAAANPPPLDGLELSPEDHHRRMEEISMPGEVSVSQRVTFDVCLFF